MLVTRPEPDASETAARLSALDIEAVVEPLLFAETLPTTLPDAAGFSALAITSANALRALHDRDILSRYLRLPVYAVGNRSAAAARTFGFEQVVSAEGSADDLVALLRHAGLTGPILYPAPQHQAVDLARALAPAGIMVITAPVYAMRPATGFSAVTRRALDAQALVAALFYSRRTAETFVKLTAGLADRTRLGMLCLSEAVAEPLVKAHFVRVGLAEHPSEEAMLALALSFARDQNPA
jgi:uroporphyrinogen-III synthase